MQTPVQIDFQGMQAKPDVRASIEKHAAQLERRYGRVTACRVVLKGPSGHHRTGGLYEVHIHLALPNGREVNIGRTPPADERHADLWFAINDAFKHARRRLQDHVRRLQGQVKQHESQPTATRPASSDSWKPPTVMRYIFIATACSAAHSAVSLWARTSRSPRRWARKAPRRVRSSCSASTG
jgi:ribosome-associated translation inhibitor RaiA